MSSGSWSHVVFFTWVAWGHLRPECALAFSIAHKFPSVAITFITDADVAAKARKEVTRHCTPDERKSVLPRIRVVAVGRANAKSTLSTAAENAVQDPRAIRIIPEHVQERFRTLFPAIALDDAFKDDNDVHWQSVGSKPSLMISDVLLGDIVLPIKKEYGLPLLLWWFGSAAAFTRHKAPEALGGRDKGYIEEVESTFADETLRKGRSFGDVARTARIRSIRVPNDIVDVKGLPPYYQWEDSPQDFWYPGLFDCVRTGPHLADAADGVLLPTVLELEPEGVQGLLDFYSLGGVRQVLCVGPQLPREYFSPEKHTTPGISAQNEMNSMNSEPDHSDRVPGDPCIAFLDQALEDYGPRSAIYISFGSTSFPPDWQMQILLETLLGMKPPMPFILTTAAAHGPVHTDLLERIRRSTEGLVVSWAPQQAISCHPALGWVVTHCGGNATFEALSQGLPIIAWPFNGDQPVHARWLSQVLDTAFELLQVRTGPGAMKAYRGGPGGTEIIGTEAAVQAEIADVLQRCKGPDGRRKRENALRAQKLILKAIQSGGQADKHLEKLAMYFS